MHQPEAQHNVLLIVTDQERRFAVDPAPLPGHDLLRARGTSYDRFYGASIACSPARAVIYTGLHALTAGVVDNVGTAQPGMSSDVPTIGSRLGDLGYHTAYIGKWHLSEHGDGEAGTSTGEVLQPFGFVDASPGGDGMPYEGYERDRRILADALCWMRSTGRRLNDDGVPWFLAVNFVNPHDVMFATWDRDFRQRGGVRAIGIRAFDGPPRDSRYQDRWDQTIEPGCFDPVAAPDRPNAHLEYQRSRRSILGDAPATTNDDLRLFRDYYVNCIRDVDEAIEQLVRELDRLLLTDRTSIVFTSDHGEMAGAHGLFGKGPFAYDENIRLPFIVIQPGVDGGTTTDALASQVDLAPTMLGLAGAGSDALVRRGLPGQDLLDRGAAGAASREEVLFAYTGVGSLDAGWRERMMAARSRGQASPTERKWDTHGFLRTIITERYKLTRYFAPTHLGAPAAFADVIDRDTFELFDLRDDSEERRNLAANADNATLELMESLSARLASLVEDEIGDDGPATMPRFAGAPWLRN